MTTLLQDLRYGLRMLAKSPGFTAVAVITLALGIGANTAIFSLLDQVMLRLLPVNKPEQLVVLRSPGPTRGHVHSDGDEAESFSFPMYKGLRENNAVFSGLLACFPADVSVAFQGQTERAGAELVSGNFFQVLGVQPVLGRMFTLGDDRVPGGHPVVVLNYGYWMAHFGGSPSVLNQSLLVNAQPMTIVGVARRGFNGVQPGWVPSLFVPIMEKALITPNWDGLSNWNDSWLALIGRLKPGIPRRTAEASLGVTYPPLLAEQIQTAGRMSQDERQQFLSKKILLDPGGHGRAVLQRDAGTPMIALFVMVALVLLIACTNIANLLLARGASRQRELAIRMALGASRWRMTRQLLVENLVCAFLGGILAMIVASWTLNTLVSWISTGTDVAGLSTEMNVRLFGFNFLLTLLAGGLFGLIPSLRATRTDVNSTLKDQGTVISAGPTHVRFRKGLVAAQAALTVLLLAGAGLFTRTLWNLRHVDLGFKPDHLLAFSLAPSLSGYSPPRAADLSDRLRAQLAALPGSESAGSATIAVMTNSDQGANVTLPGAESLTEEELDINQNWVSPGYFSTLGVPLIAGREFTPADGATSPKVAIINEAMQRRFFHDKNPIGSRFAIGGGNVKPDIEIVGVVRNAKNSEVREKNRPYAYMPYSQDPKLSRMTFYVRTLQDPLTLAPIIRKKVQELDPNLPVSELKTEETVIDENLFAERLVAMLAAVFGTVAAFLASLGIYGVLAYVVTLRTREIGIRIALGAAKQDVLGMIVGQGLVPVAVGMAIGLALALAVTRGLRGLLYGIAPNDPVTFLAVGLLLGAVALVASYLPARRAAKVDPMVALRYE